VAFITAIAAQLPEAGAITRNTTSEAYGVTSFGSIDMNFLLLAFCSWVLLSCTFLTCTAFLCGRAHAQRAVDRLATMRPTIASTPYASSGPPALYPRPTPRLSGGTSMTAARTAAAAAAAAATLSAGRSGGGSGDDGSSAGDAADFLAFRDWQADAEQQRASSPGLVYQRGGAV
jgi:hypothetical protein